MMQFLYLDASLNLRTSVIFGSFINIEMALRSRGVAAFVGKMRQPGKQE